MTAQVARTHMIDIVAVDISHVHEMHDIEAITYPTPWSIALFMVELSKPESSWFVAVDDGVVVGYIGLQDVAGVGHLLNLAVRPDRRREGIGTALLARVLDAARSRRMEGVTLEVRQSNLEAQALYGCFGFARVGRRPGYYTDTGEDAVIMTLGPLERVDRNVAGELDAEQDAEPAAPTAIATGP